MPLHLRVGDRFIGPGRIEEVPLRDDLVRVQVYSGLATGPRFFVLAGMNLEDKLSVELARELGQALDPRHLHGTVLLVAQASAGPPRKRGKAAPPPVGDLNRVFPGNADADLTHQVAHLLFREIVSRSDFGIELVGAPDGRSALPHIRGNLDNPYVRRLCESFGANVVLDGPGPARSLRRVATEFGVPTIAYHVGGAGRGEKTAMQEGIKGILGVMSNLRMLGAEVPWRGASIVVRDARWLEASRAGRLDMLVQPGATLRKGDVIARIEGAETIAAPAEVLVLGVNTNRSVEAGEPVCEVANPVDNNAARNAGAHF